MGDANGLDPPAKSQAMEGDLVGDLVGEKRGRELELEKKSGVNEWVGSSTSPSPHNLIQEPTAREPGGRLQEPTAIAGGVGPFATCTRPLTARRRQGTYRHEGRR